MLCFKHNARKDFSVRRDLMVQHWCVEKKKGEGEGSPKCKQLQMQKELTEAKTDEERKTLSAKMRASSMLSKSEALRTETTEMMASICASELGSNPVFTTPCALGK